MSEYDNQFQDDKYILNNCIEPFEFEVNVI
jgi:hypothetical protein